jgi:hypothetical protein
MEGFENIDLSSSRIPKSKPARINDKVRDAQAPSPSYARKPKTKWAFFRLKNNPRAILVLAGVLLFFTFGIVLPARNVYKSAKAAQTQAQRTADALKAQNIELTSQELVKTKEELEKTQKDLNSMFYLRFVPLINNYYNDADHLLKAGEAGLEAGEVFVNSIKPYADVLGLKGEGTFVGGTAEKRIETAVKTMDKVTPHIDEIEKHLKVVKEEMDQVSPGHYPKILGLGKIQDQLTSARNIADNSVTFIGETKPLIKVLPSLLGEPEEKKYLVLFQNDKELRPTGGFITAYAIFRIDKGVIHVDKSENIYNLDNTIPNKPKAPAPILKYFPKVREQHLRDSNLSPDFIESMKEFNTLYERAGAAVDVDGIIALDTHVLVSTIKILDDNVQAGGKTFNTKIDPRCDCPQVIYELEKDISTPLSLDLRVTSLEAVQASRKAIIGDLLYAIMEKALKSSPKQYWGSLFQDFFKQIETKHVMFYLYDKGAQQGIHAVNADGKIRSFDGDYLHINESNFSGSKANLYMSKTVTQDYKKKGDKIEKTVTINFKNSHKASDCNLERGGLCLNSVYKSWFRIYTPKGSKLVDSRGSEAKITSYEDLGKTVFDGFITVRPLGTATFKITYILPDGLTEDDEMPLFIQKQPGLGDEEYSASVDGKKSQKIILSKDTEIKIDL